MKIATSRGRCAGDADGSMVTIPGQRKSLFFKLLHCKLSTLSIIFLYFFIGQPLGWREGDHCCLFDFPRTVSSNKPFIFIVPFTDPDRPQQLAGGSRRPPTVRSQHM